VVGIRAVAHAALLGRADRILATALLVKWLFWRSGGAPHQPPSKTAPDILKERYSRGEIGRDEFERKKRDLED
jgi:putative membrane protein